MIVCQVKLKQTTKVLELIDALVKEKYAINGYIDLENEITVNFITKSLLFNEIDKYLDLHFG